MTQRSFVFRVLCYPRQTYDDATFYGEIEGFQGVYATGKIIEACRKELMEVLEEWILLSIARHLPLPKHISFQALLP